MGNQLDISNVVQVSLSATPKGIGQYNVNNIGLFTNDDYNADAFGNLGYKIYLNPREIALDFGTNSRTYKMALAIFSQTPNILNGNGYLAVIPFITVNDENETLTQAIIRASELVAFYGILSTKAMIYQEFQDASDYVQSINKLYFEVGTTTSCFQPNGLFDAVRLKGNYHTRCLAYLNTENDAPKLMMAAYASRALSVNFSGSNTTITMHLKDLLTIEPDPMMSQTYLNQCQAAGVDVYVNIAGVPKVFTSGANWFFDRAYNLGWFIGAIEVAGFNVLATSSSKIAQTEDGMTILKSAYTLVCEKAVRNSYIAPGTWNSPDRFGDPEAMLRIIEERGYYIYSLPVNQQDQTDRDERKAPLVQLAIKEAGAIHSTGILLYVNA